MSNPISTDVFVIPRNGQYVVYAPLRRLAFLGNAALVNFIHRLKQGASPLDAQETALLKLFAELRLTGEAGDTPIFTLGSNVYKPAEVTLFLTARCNLRCLYCYASAGAGRHADMSLATAKQGIEFVCRNARDLGRRSFGVGYHGGGEPTVHWEVLSESVVYARQLGREYNLELRASLATNGVFSEAKCRWITANMQSATLSLDGLPEVQDAQRPSPSGGASSRAVFRTLERFEKAAFPYGIRMTATARSTEKLPESLRYILDHARPRRIQVEPVYELGRGQNAALHVQPATFVRAFREARTVAQQHGVELLFSAARLDVLTNRFCQSCGDGFSLTPGGNVSACYEVCDEQMNFAEEFIFGRYDDSAGRYVFDAEKLRRLRARSVESIPWCRDCFCKWHCAGDCPNKARHAMQDGEFSGHARCEITQALVLDQILEKISRHGGVYWAENQAPAC